MKLAKLAELGTFLFLIVLIAGLTYQHRDYLSKNKDASNDIKSALKQQSDDAEFLSRAHLETISHDHNTDTKTVFVTLDASESFDGGNTAGEITYTRFVSDYSKPICTDFEIDCTPECISSGDCKIQRNECNEEMYEPKCARYEDGCNSAREDCDCIQYLEVEVDYHTDCEYNAKSHDERAEYLDKIMALKGKKFRPDPGLTFLWEADGLDIPKSKANKPIITIELTEGEYLFKCTTTDSYGSKDVATQWVIISEEPNNNPETNIVARPATTKESNNQKKAASAK